MKAYLVEEIGMGVMNTKSILALDLYSDRPRPRTPNIGGAMNQADLDTLVICAVRYAMGRMTYVVGDVARIAATANTTPQARDMIIRDLAEAIDRDNYARSSVVGDALYGGFPLGMNCDRSEWELLYNDLRTRG